MEGMNDVDLYGLKRPKPKLGKKPCKSWARMFFEFYLIVNELSDNLVMAFCFHSFYNFFLRNTNKSS